MWPPPHNQRLTALPRPPIPQVAIPTTLSASEATWSVTINRPERKFKDHVRHPDLVPRAVILDARHRLVHSCRPVVRHRPQGYGARGGRSSTPWTAIRWWTTCASGPASCCTAICRAARTTRRTWRPSPSATWRWWAWGFHGRGVHKGLSQVIGWQLGAYGVAHGHTSCVMLPHVMEFKPLRQPVRPGRPRPRPWEATGTTDEELAQGAQAAVAGMVRDMDLPCRLRDVGVPRDDLPDIAGKVIVSPQHHLQSEAGDGSRGSPGGA